MANSAGEHGFRKRPLAGFRTVEKRQGPERHHGHGQGGEREIAPARVEYQAERGLRGDERRHDQRDAQHVGHEKRRQALRSAPALQETTEARAPTSRHRWTAAAQRCLRPAASPGPASRRARSFRAASCRRSRPAGSRRRSRTRRPRATMPMAAARPALQREQGCGEYADAKKQPACHLQLPERIVADRHPGRIFQLAFGPVEQPPIAAHRPFPAALPRLVIGLEQIDAKIVLSAPARESRK